MPANAATARMPAAAPHPGKPPSAIPALRANLGISLVGASSLLSLVQSADMTLGLLVGLAADTIGLRRSILIGLPIVTVASVGGACTVRVAPPVVAGLAHRVGGWQWIWAGGVTLACSVVGIAVVRKLGTTKPGATRPPMRVT